MAYNAMADDGKVTKIEHFVMKSKVGWNGGKSMMAGSMPMPISRLNICWIYHMSARPSGRLQDL